MIRLTEEDDLSEVLSLAADFFRELEIACIQELLETYLYKPGQKDYVFLSCEDGGRMIAFVCYGPTPLTEATFSLYWICTGGSYQRHSVGSALLADVETRIARQGARLLLVETSSTADYAPARRFYSRHGFKQLAVIPDFYAMGDDLITYGKRCPGVRGKAAHA